MTGYGLLLMACLAPIPDSSRCLAPTSDRGAEAQGQRVDIRGVASTLDLTDRGAAKWLERLQRTGSDGPKERLMAVSLSGETLMELEGDRASVHVNADMDRLLLKAERSIILVHNHPSNVGLSAADIGQLSKPGVVAIVAIAHDRSVFVAMRGVRAHAGLLIEQQYEGARSETQRRLRTAMADGVPATEADAQLSHLVCRALDKTGVIRYWAELRGPSRESYDARAAFRQVVEGTAASVRDKRPQ